MVMALIYIIILNFDIDIDIEPTTTVYNLFINHCIGC